MDFIDCFVRDDSEALRAYIEAGGDLNAPIEPQPRYNNLCGTLVHHAIVERARKCLQLLISAGADLEMRYLRGCTPLLVACFYGCVEEALILLQNGADVNAVTTRTRYGPLHYIQMGYFASIEEKVRLARILLDFGADRNLLDSYGAIPGADITEEEEELLDTFRNYYPCLDVKEPGMN